VSHAICGLYRLLMIVDGWSILDGVVCDSLLSISDVFFFPPFFWTLFYGLFFFLVLLFFLPGHSRNSYIGYGAGEVVL